MIGTPVEATGRVPMDGEALRRLVWRVRKVCTGTGFFSVRSQNATPYNPKG
jgi:hypothetical protein